MSTPRPTRDAGSSDYVLITLPLLAVAMLAGHLARHLGWL